MGRLLTVISGQQTRSYQYDGLGRVTQTTTPETGYQPTNISYTDFGAQSQITDPRVLPGTTTHIVTTFGYDGLNRIKSVSYNDGTPTIAYTYNPPQSSNNTGGRLATTSNGVASETYQYDLMGRITKCQKTIGGQIYTILYSYHADGTLASLTYPSGRVVAFNEDAIGRINQIQNNGTMLVTVAAFNAAGRILSETYGNGVVGSYSYNNQMQMASRVYGTATVPLLNLTYNYGNAQDNGQIIGITDNVLGSRSFAYTYDTLGHLVLAGTIDLTSPNTWKLEFTYDRYGNRLSELPIGGTASMPSNQVLIDPTTNHITSQGYAYDAAGNMISDGLFSYTYDALGKVTSVAPFGSPLPTSKFSYDGTGLRVIKDSTVYIYSGRKVIAEYPLGGTAASPTVENIYRGKMRLATISDGIVSFHFADNLSDRVDADWSGNVIRSYGHYPFGETWYETGSPDKWKFTTYENDIESGLNYADARFQSPRLGRYMSVDPLAGLKSNPQSLNRYIYANDDPINITDSTGKVRDDYCEDFEDICDDGGDIDGDNPGPRTPDGEDDGGSTSFISNNDGQEFPIQTSTVFFAESVLTAWSCQECFSCRGLLKHRTILKSSKISPKKLHG